MKNKPGNIQHARLKCTKWLLTYVLCLYQKLIVGGIYNVSMTVIMNGISEIATLIKSLCCYEMLHNQAGNAHRLKWVSPQRYHLDMHILFYNYS
jgi:hypothetical protein